MPHQRRRHSNGSEADNAAQQVKRGTTTFGVFDSDDDIFSVLPKPGVLGGDVKGSVANLAKG